MRIALGSDHAGFDLKQHLIELVRKLGHEPVDKGAFDASPSDYPDFAEAVGMSVASGETARGILICGSGVGASIAVNKVQGARGALCHDTYSAHQGVEHDDMNVLVLGSRIIGTAVAEELVQSYLKATFSNEARHLRRLNKVLAIEARYAGASLPRQEKP